MFNKVYNISTTDAINLVKNCSTKTNEIENKVTTDHDKYITTQEYNKLLSENFAAKLKQANLASKTDIPENTDIVKKTDFDDKLKIPNKNLTSNKTRGIEFKIKLDNLVFLMELIFFLKWITKLRSI